MFMSLPCRFRLAGASALGWDRGLTLISTPGLIALVGAAGWASWTSWRTTTPAATQLRWPAT